MTMKIIVTTTYTTRDKNASSESDQTTTQTIEFQGVGFDKLNAALAAATKSFFSLFPETAYEEVLAGLRVGFDTEEGESDAPDNGV